MRKTFLVSLVAVLALLAVISASVLATDIVTIGPVEVNRMDASSGLVSVEAGEVAPISVFFTANDNASDVQVSAWIQGHRSDSVEEDFADLIEDKEYHARLTLTMPEDLDETEEALTLFVRVETDAGNVEESYILNVQREPFKTDILFVETDTTIDAGTSVPIDVVIKNIGRHELEDMIVAVSIPELGIMKRAYFSDLTPTDNEDEEGNEDEDATDAAQGKIFLKIPTNTKSGIYELFVEASNDDTRSVVKKDLEIVGAEEGSRVLVPVTSKEIATGDTAIYTLTIVNSGNRIGIYEIIPETAEGVIVSVKEPIVTVKAGESKIVELEVKAGSRDGTYSFAVNVNSENKLLQRVVFNAKVVKGQVVTRSNLTILTVILAIIFLVLLIVLIVLLTRRPMRKEELEESYY